MNKENKKLKISEEDFIPKQYTFEEFCEYMKNRFKEINKKFKKK